MRWQGESIVCVVKEVLLHALSRRVYCMRCQGGSIACVVKEVLLHALARRFYCMRWQGGSIACVVKEVLLYALSRRIYCMRWQGDSIACVVKEEVVPLVHQVPCVLSVAGSTPLFTLLSLLCRHCRTTLMRLVLVHSSSWWRKGVRMLWATEWMVWGAVRLMETDCCIGTLFGSQCRLLDVRVVDGSYACFL
jgi:hypothetical protein